MGVETQTPESSTPELPKITSKIVIVDDLARILILRRSNFEDTRRLDPDLPGGKHDGDPGETPFDTLKKELGQELPGSDVFNYTPLTPPEGHIKDDGSSITHVWAGNIIPPEDGIRLSREHDRHYWLPKDLFEVVRIQPKYLSIVAASRRILEGMIESAPVSQDSGHRHLHVVGATG